MKICEKGLGVQEEVQKICGVSEISPHDIKEDTIAPIVIGEHKKKILVKRNEDGATSSVEGYAYSVFWDFESYSRLGKIPEDNIELTLKHYTSKLYH